MDQPSATRIRRPSLVAAPLFVFGLIGSSFALALILWGVWYSDQLNATFWVPLAVTGVVGIVGFAATRGCFVDVTDDQIRDVVGWLTISRTDRTRVVTARVRPGAWRWFELELDDGSQRVLLGASPVQFPARLLIDAEAQDVSVLDQLLVSADS